MPIDSTDWPLRDVASGSATASARQEPATEKVASVYLVEYKGVVIRCWTAENAVRVALLLGDESAPGSRAGS